jgi:transcriptional regulator with XRE-family HTH domain
MTTFGGRLRELRKARGLSQQAIAGDGISSGYVSLIESDKRVPSAATVQRLADRLGVPVEQLLGHDESPAADQARLEVNFAKLALANSDPAEAVRCLAKVDLAQLDLRTACDAALVLAESLQETGQLDRAVGVLESVVDRCRREQSWIVLAQASTVLAVMYIESGDVARSVETAQSAIRDVEASGLAGTDEHIRLGSVFVSALLERGDLVFATRSIEDMIAVTDRVGTTRARGSVYWTAAAVAHERGRLAEALRLTDRAVALLGEQEDSRDLPRLRMNYAWLLLNDERPRANEALVQLDLAESDPALTASQLDRGTAATFRGRAHLLLGDLDDAAENAARALQLLGPSEHTERAAALLLLGDVGTAQGNMDLAMESYRETERVLTRMQTSRRVARAWRELGDAWQDLGETRRALAAYDRAMRMVGLAARRASTRVWDRAEGAPLSVR